MVRAAAGLRRRARPSGSRACSEYSQGALGTHDGGCSGYSRRVLRRAVGTTASSGAGPSPRQCSRSSSTKSAGLVGASPPPKASHRNADAAREGGISCGGATSGPQGREGRHVCAATRWRGHFGPFSAAARRYLGVQQFKMQRKRRKYSEDDHKRLVEVLVPHSTPPPALRRTAAAVGGPTTAPVPAPMWAVSV